MSAQKQSERILVFSASMRAESLNTKLAALVAAHLRTRGVEVSTTTMRELECVSYDGDAEISEGIPPGAHTLNRLLGENDAFVIVSPEYNASMPGVLKNVIDWTSRFRPQPFDTKHALLLSASPSMAGGNRGLWSLRMPLEHLGTRVYPDMFSLAVAHKAFAGDRLADAGLQKRFEQTIDAFAELVEAAKHYPCIKHAWFEFLGEPADTLRDRNTIKPSRPAS